MLFIKIKKQSIFALLIKYKESISQGLISSVLELIVESGGIHLDVNNDLKRRVVSLLKSLKASLKLKPRSCRHKRDKFIG